MKLVRIRRKARPNPVAEIHILRCRSDVDNEAYPDVADARVSEIWQAGIKISGGHGFWMSSSLWHHRNPKEMVKAWVDGCSRYNLCDLDIVLYGDWTDGRHIADNIDHDYKYSELVKHVAANVEGRTKAHIEKENETYFDREEVAYAAYVYLHVTNDLPAHGEPFRLVRQ